MASKDFDLKAWIAEHPRMMGVLFVLVALLSQVGTVAAGSAGTTVGI